MQTISKWTDEYIRHTNRKGLALLALRANATAAIDERDAMIANMSQTENNLQMKVKDMTIEIASLKELVATLRLQLRIKDEQFKALEKEVKEYQELLAKITPKR